MHHEHLTREFLHRLYSGRRIKQDLMARLYAHLREVCPQCRRAWDGFHEDLPQGISYLRDRAAAVEQAEELFHGTDQEFYGSAWEKVNLRMAMANEDIPRRKAGSPAVLAELLGLPAGERDRAAREHPRFAGNLPLVERLLEASYGQMPGRPEEALTLARLAMAVCEGAEALSPDVSEGYARALGHVGNALRVLCQLEEAARSFSIARFLLRWDHGDGNRRLLAELDHLEGSLLRDRRQLEEAEMLLSRAVEIFRCEGMRVESASAQLTLSMVYRERGELERSITITEEVLQSLDRTREPRLFLMARHNLASRYVEHGDCETAQRIFDETADLYLRFPDAPTQLRRLWLEARIAHGLGATQTAESCYRAAREGWQREKRPFDMALVSLDLAQLLLHQGRTSELKPLAEEVVSVFESAGVHREAQAAVLLFADAVRLEQLTAAYVLELARFLEVSRSNPALAFARAM